MILALVGLFIGLVHIPEFNSYSWDSRIGYLVVQNETFLSGLITYGLSSPLFGCTLGFVIGLLDSSSITVHVKML